MDVRGVGQLPGGYLKSPVGTCISEGRGGEGWRKKGERAAMGATGICNAKGGGRVSKKACRWRTGSLRAGKEKKNR